MPKFIIFLLLLFVGICPIKSQVVNVGFGPIFESSIGMPKLAGGSNDFENTTYSFNFSVFYPITNKITFGLQYQKNSGYTFIPFNEGSFIEDDGISTIGRGFSGAKLIKFNGLIKYNIFQNFKRFYLSPSVGLGIQHSKKLNVDFWGDARVIAGPDYFETRPMWAETTKTTQPIGVAGIHFGFVFWNHLDIGLSVQGTYANKPYQKLFLDYTYKDETQVRNAIYQSTGTGMYVSFGIGYRFGLIGEK